MDIRTRLRADLDARFTGDRIRNEMGLCLGETRVDIAVINGHLHGYEIKSERDTLTRLSNQVSLYDRVLDYSTIVTGHRHLQRIMTIVPDHWGVIEASDVDGLISLRAVRRARLNRSLDPLAVAQLLWRGEAAAILVDLGQQVQRRETRWDLWHRLAALPLRALQSHVRHALKVRRDWPGG